MSHKARYAIEFNRLPAGTGIRRTRKLNCRSIHAIQHRAPRLAVAGILMLVFASTGWGQQVAPQEKQTIDAPRQKQSVKPGINATFLDPNLDVNAFVERFELESREIFGSRKQVLRELGIRPGEEVADIGAGTGFYSLMFATTTGPEGQVFSVEIASRFLEHIRERTNEADIHNVTPVLSQFDNCNLPAESTDVVFICDTYHHFEYPDDTMRSVHRAMRDNGRLFVVDFERIPGKSREWILNHVRAGKETVIEEIQAAGFQLVREVPIHGFVENYMLEFRKSPIERKETR